MNCLCVGLFGDFVYKIGRECYPSCWCSAGLTPSVRFLDTHFSSATWLSMAEKTERYSTYSFIFLCEMRNSFTKFQVLKPIPISRTSLRDNCENVRRGKPEINVKLHQESHAWSQTGKTYTRKLAFASKFVYKISKQTYTRVVQKTSQKQGGKQKLTPHKMACRRVPVAIDETTAVHRNVKKYTGYSTYCNNSSVHRLLGKHTITSIWELPYHEAIQKSRQ